MTDQLKFRLGQHVRKVGVSPYSIPLGATGRVTAIVKKDVTGNLPFYPYRVSWGEGAPIYTIKDYPMQAHELEAIDA